MAIPGPVVAIRNVRRYREIVGVLIKYGFGEIVDRLNLSTLYRFGRKVFRRRPAPELNYAQRIRLALEELGPTFVKLGQVLSMRPFLIPPDLVRELAKLQDQVTPMDPALAIKTVEENLRGKVTDAFADFDSIPIASASLSQVHNARLHDGTLVVVKVQRPGIRKVIEADMIILKDIAALMERYIPESKQYEPGGLVTELARTTKKEINFLYEARNIEIFARNFKNDKKVFIPKVYWDFTTRRMLTMERIDGIKINEIDKLKEIGIDTTGICQIGGDMVFQMVFENGFFHADPHPGNLFVTRDGRIAPVDYGMVGTLSSTQLGQLADILTAIVSNDAAMVVYSFSKADVFPETAEMSVIEGDINEMITRYHRIPLSKIDMATLSDEFFDIVNRHKIRIQSEFMVFGKALVTYEEVARVLDPDYNFILHAAPYVKRLVLKKFRPGHLSKDIRVAASELHDFLVKFPVEARKFTTKLNKGRLKLGLEILGLDRLIIELDRSSNRLSFAIIIAAIIVGSSMIMQLDIGLKVFGLPIVGLIGYLFAGILGAGLAISILRSGKL